MSKEVVRLEHISKKYQDRFALSDVNLSMHEGEILGFIGPNGAGKSTLISLICGLSRPTEGIISVLGQKVTDVSDVSKVAVVSDRFGFIPYFSARKNLMLLASIRGEASSEKIDECLFEVGLDARDKKPVKDFSLGMKQRLLIAQALIEDPKVLLMDEPSNSLDAEGVIKLRELLQKQSERGVSILLASHLLTEVERICHRVVLVKSGKLMSEFFKGQTSWKEAPLQVVFSSLDDYQKFVAHPPMIFERVDSIYDLPTVQMQHTSANTLIAWFANNNIHIEEIFRKQSTLEDHFLELVSRS